MVSRRLLLGATLGCLLIGLLGIAVYLQQRIARCDAVPLLAPELLPNAKLDASTGGGSLPTGWVGATSGISVTDFTVLPGGHSLQLLGIANYVQTPEVAPVRPGRVYCFKGQAITDSPAGSTTRVRITFQWLDDTGALVGADATPWQPVVLWQPEQPPAGWSIIDAAFRAPPGATRLRVRVSPASDDRVYLDQMHVRRGVIGDGLWGTQAPLLSPIASRPSPVVVLPWPDNHRAALSFSFDWETAMGGLVHSRSVGEPLGNDKDYVKRGLRMRQGITNTLEIFRPYRVRATYYATGYNFLLGNTERRTFMGNPTFTWAITSNRWLSDRWQHTPWFADDPYGTVESDPAWYFGDLVPLLQREGQDIQSHTFSHLYGGLATTAQWQADFAAWKEAAAERSVPPARSLAFPWSGSGGMSDASWNVLEEQGIRSVTRLSDLPFYAIMRESDPHCRPVPGHERILACPDFYLTPASAQGARELIDNTVAVSGTLDLWSHTEEVTSDEQIAAWRATVAYAVSKPDLWIAPLDEITSWQQALAELKIDNVTMQPTTSADQATALLSFKITNTSERDLAGLCLQLPWKPGKTTLDGQIVHAQSSTSNVLALDVKAGQSVEVRVWPAS